MHTEIEAHCDKREAGGVFIKGGVKIGGNQRERWALQAERAVLKNPDLEKGFTMSMKCWRKNFVAGDETADRSMTCDGLEEPREVWACRVSRPFKEFCIYPTSCRKILKVWMRRMECLDLCFGQICLYHNTRNVLDNGQWGSKSVSVEAPTLVQRRNGQCTDRWVLVGMKSAIREMFKYVIIATALWGNYYYFVVKEIGSKLLLWDYSTNKKKSKDYGPDIVTWSVIISLPKSLQGGSWRESESIILIFPYLTPTPNTERLYLLVFGGKLTRTHSRLKV